MTVMKDDNINAHNEFNREGLMIRLRELAKEKPQLATVANAADSQLRLKPQIYTRTNETGVGIVNLCTSEQGGGPAVITAWQ